MSVLQVIGDSIVHAAGTPFEALGFRLDETLELQLHERMIGILGATGSGKSSFLSILANQAVGFSALYGGEVLHPPKVGLVFQQPEDQLFLATVREELSYAPANLGCALPDEAQMLKLLQTVGFSNPDVILLQDPMKLSGGEKRRVALASILAMQPEILVLDEPFAGLDPFNMGLILRLFMSLKRSGVSIIFSGHQACEMSLFCDEILGFQEQKIHCRGEPRSILPWLIEYSGLDFFQQWLDLVQSGRDKAERDYLKRFRRIYA